MRPGLFTMLAGVLLSGCTLVPQAQELPPEEPPWPYEDAWFDHDRIQVATFNADWLWDHTGGEYEPRTETDYEMIGELIARHDLDLVALQEIDGDAAMELLDLPDDYSWTVGTTGWSQNLAILWKHDQLQVDGFRQIPLPGTAYPSKDPLVARVRHVDGALDFTFVNVHLAAYDDRESAEYRANQVEQLKHWLEEELPLTEEDPTFAERVVVAGDFNDTFQGIHGSIDTLEPFEEDPAWVFATEDTDEYTQIPYRSKIDHLLLSEDILPRYDDRGLPDGCKVIKHDQLSPWSDYEGGWNGEQVISDHRPVWVYLDVN